VSAERRAEILALLKKRGTLYLKELEVLFPQVSSMTLRRDLDYLEKAGEAIRIKGGIRLAHPDRMEDVFNLRLAQRQEEKARIARIAAEYIEPNRSIYIDPGTTGLNLARLMPDTNLFVLTSGLQVALEVCKKRTPTVNLLGGQINRNNMSVADPRTVKSLEEYNFDLAFIAPAAISLDHGCSNGDYNDCELKRRIMQKATMNIAMADVSKLDKVMPFTFAEFGQIHLLITDRKPPQHYLDAAEARGIKVRWE
jgi:DeoR/GlpR family transcriptional regulator of sugar metabolism